MHKYNFAVPEQFHALAVWRYMSLGRFLWMLQENALWLARLDQLGDAWEGYLSGKRFEEYFSQSSQSEKRDQIESWVKQQYVNCWHRATVESDAMWKIYCASIEGVAIKTTIGKLAKIASAQLDTETVRVVLAMQYGESEPLWSYDQLIPGVQKRPMFSHESEIRLIVWQQFDSKDSPKGIRLLWDPVENIEEIRIHPRADTSTESAIRKSVELAVPSLSDRIHASAMAALPFSEFAD